MKKSLDLCYRHQLKMCSRRSRRRRLGEDRISSLPDDILLFIMSLLTFKDVIKTVILSRRWLDLLVHTPLQVLLNFHSSVSDSRETEERERRHYIKWVNHVLRWNKGLYLKEFKIVFDLDNFDRKAINRWLVFALERRVERLELNLLLSGRYPNKINGNFVFPSRFLNLSRWSKFSPFDLKYLKSLSLKSVDVTGEAVNFILIDCPFLERLEVNGTRKLVNLVISDTTLALKYLQIKNCNALEVISITKVNLVSLEIPCIDDLTLTDIPILVELTFSERSLLLSHSLSQTSSCHSQLKVLSLYGFKLEDVTQLSNFDEMTKLKRLTIRVGAWGDESLTKLISLINSCPCLEEFVLKLTWFKPERTNRIILSSSSSIKSKSLKVFEFMGYYGRVSDVELIIHVVDNAFALEKIIIDPRNVLSMEGLLRPYKSEREEEAKSIALQQFEDLRKSIPQHVHLHIRY